MGDKKQQSKSDTIGKTSGSHPLDRCIDGVRCGVCRKERTYLGQGSMYEKKIWVCGFKCFHMISERNRGD